VSKEERSLGVNVWGFRVKVRLRYIACVYLLQNRGTHIDFPARCLGADNRTSAPWRVTVWMCASKKWVCSSGIDALYVSACCKIVECRSDCVLPGLV